MVGRILAYLCILQRASLADKLDMAATERKTRYSQRARIRRWTLSARNTLVATIRRILRFGKAASETQLPGMEDKLGKQVQKFPGKAIELLQAGMDNAPIENKLKSAKTETEFLKQELLREQIANTREGTRGMRLCNAARESEIRKRLSEITDAKRDINTTTDGQNEVVIVGSLPNLIEDRSGNREHIGALDLTGRITKCLGYARITEVDELYSLGRKRILAIKGIGRKALAEIESALARRGIRLDD